MVLWYREIKFTSLLVGIIVNLRPYPQISEKICRDNPDREETAAKIAETTHAGI